MKIIIRAVVNGDISEDAQFDAQAAVEETLKEHGYDLEDIGFFIEK